MTVPLNILPNLSNQGRCRDGRSTLKYRDHVLKSKGITVTVEDVRVALGWLVPSLQTGRLPETDDKIRLDLLKIWLDELRALGHPNMYLS
jgi:hypothetical protein